MEKVLETARFWDIKSGEVMATLISDHGDRNCRQAARYRLVNLWYRSNCKAAKSEDPRGASNLSAV